MMRALQEGKRAMESDDEYWQELTKRDKEQREHNALCALRRAQRRKLTETLLSDDLLSRIAPQAHPGSDEVLAEHLAQLRTVVRYALQFVLADDLSLETNLSAANTTQRLIQTNIALAKVLSASESTKSKTVRGGRARKEPRD
jgi:hypothetical protein